MFAGGIKASILSFSPHNGGSDTKPSPRSRDRVGFAPRGACIGQVAGSRSRYIRYLANEKNQTTMSSLNTSQRGWSLTAPETASK